LLASKKAAMSLWSARITPRPTSSPPDLAYFLTARNKLVFPTEVGTPEQAPNMFYRRFLPALRRAGLPRIRFHNLRHTYASLLIAQGEHPKYIQSQMGHSSITVTMDTYGHLMNTVNRDAASRLGEQVLGSRFSGHGSSLVAEKSKGARE